MRALIVVRMHREVGMKSTLKSDDPPLEQITAFFIVVGPLGGMSYRELQPCPLITGW